MQSNAFILPSEQRPIALRRRLDLVVQETVYQGQRSWIVKDPVALKYFRLLEPEYEVLQMLDQSTSYRKIKLRLEKRFPRPGNSRLVTEFS